ncbi:hypothetical protein AgCh_025451 [Apium graveolens]
MNSIASRVSSSLFKRPSTELNSLSSQLNRCRGIRVRVFQNNLERALAFMQKQMTSSGVERLIKNEQTHHIKNSEKRVLARKNLERRLKSQDLARKLKSILIKKVSEVPSLVVRLEHNGLLNSFIGMVNHSEIPTNTRVLVEFWIFPMVCEQRHEERISRRAREKAIRI